MGEVQRVDGGDVLDPGILEADRVEQSAPHLGHPRRRVAIPRVKGRPLGEEGAQPVHVDELAQLETVAGSAACQADGSGKDQTAPEVDTQVGSGHATCAGGRASSPGQSTSETSLTGP